MKESFESSENINEQEVIDALDTKGIEDAETRELVEKFVDRCHAEADAQAVAEHDSKEISNRANILADIKIALLYSKTKKYKEQALESLEDARLAATQSVDTSDLVDQIDNHIANFTN
jgi:hypothetical protein